MRSTRTGATPFRPLTIAGLMSGTSGDGIDIALVRIDPKAKPRRAGGEAGITIELLAHRGFPFPRALRAAVLAAQDARRTSTAELGQLHWRLGLAYAAAFEAMRSSYAGAIDLVGCHGQTIYHRGAPATYAGARFTCTWQIGEMAPLARVAGVPVISNFRPADVAAGGQGAPLVPLLDQTLYRHSKRTRVLQNLGGIGNLTVVPPLGSRAATIAFDTGPGNMVIDALMRQLFRKNLDRGGKTAARGAVLLPVVEAILRDPFYAQAPPRSAGREQYGARFAARFLTACRKHSRNSTKPEDAIATATALTAHSVAFALQRFVFPNAPAAAVDLIVAGGGANNATLMEMLRTLLTPSGVAVLLSSDASLPASLPVEAKEATAFALLAYMSWHRRPGNVPSATGAGEPVVLGQITCG